jgi:hypothetical protein
MTGRGWNIRVFVVLLFVDGRYDAIFRTEHTERYDGLGGEKSITVTIHRKHLKED